MLIISEFVETTLHLSNLLHNKRPLKWKLTMPHHLSQVNLHLSNPLKHQVLLLSLPHSLSQQKHHLKKPNKPRVIHDEFIALQTDSLTVTGHIIRCILVFSRGGV